MKQFKKGVLNEHEMAILCNSTRAYFGNNKDLVAIKAEVIVLKAGEYIDFDKRYISAIREFSSRHHHKNPEKKFSVYRQVVMGTELSVARIARIK